MSTQIFGIRTNDQVTCAGIPLRAK